MPDPIQKISLSRHARMLLDAHPAWRDELVDPAPFARTDMTAALRASAAAPEAEVKKILRRLRQRVLLRVMARDLAGRAGLDEVCATMSDLAEAEIEAALAWAGAPGLIVVAMGKLGGRELNVSSDIDLVLVYAGGGREGPEKAGRKLVALLSERSEDGFAFRVDLRLRPYGDSGPLAIDLEALEDYFVTQGREWERYAWIKARPITGPRRDELEAIRRPFVFRKYLDFGALESLRRMHAEVRREVERRELAGNIKLGPGGIREIEFVVQALQLVRGGRDPELTARPTLEVLDKLAAKRLLPEAAARELAAAYEFLRRLEHRLQYLDDRQTHELPENAEDRARIAAMCGFGSWDACAARLAEVRDAVAAQFRLVLAGTAPRISAEAWPEHPRFASLHASRRYAALPEDSRRRLNALAPALARAAARTPDPEATVARGCDLMEAIAGRAAYLALLVEHPKALERVVGLIAASSWAAEYVARHPLLLDELLDDRLLFAPPDWAQFEAEARRALAAAAGDLEREMNVVREQHQAQLFRLLAQDLAGLLTVERLADHLSALADLALGLSLERTWAQLRLRHREGAPRFAVIGYGKLGGKELGYASDLDMVFLYDDADERAPEVYARLAQRFNHWLTARTSAGALFDTDLRLRPSGEAGLLVSSLAAFERYQERDAWTWEHQALTRARFCAGDRDIGERFERIREKVIAQPRDPQALAREVAAMREKMHAAHPNRSQEFDLKHDAGGMIDVEFAVQFLVLAHAHRFADLARNLGNIALLNAAGGHGLIAVSLAGRCADAYREFRRAQHRLRLNGARFARVPEGPVSGHRAAVRELWSALFGR